LKTDNCWFRACAARNGEFLVALGKVSRWRERSRWGKFRGVREPIAFYDSKLGGTFVVNRSRGDFKP